ncbi:hypothetical protein SODALDRAFT_337756 [Sodiomyces alkalinus F11]|uniref:Zn(2)-C6 fungal-type domain-containing protein n=1 Tax=Sodiomyces alkalinus (strain CBS 110278 / VKM F-3762 / F11) TaxID=1314773 RepID=A0A3N2PKY8_SODAK|nr:hypothetical protein SODALDRAFT_337756 [Sodiomyces alkalinus F11]ROT35185.1 hypothetical protein SODALDRAFT_337756 [Sodiomyces alkalinus F11]
MSAAPAPPKQIRFVHSQGQPPSKRRRINAACLTCRKRKTKCAGERPACSTCTKNGHECLGYPECSEKKPMVNGPGNNGGKGTQTAPEDEEQYEGEEEVYKEGEGDEDHKGRWKPSESPAKFVPDNVNNINTKKPRPNDANTLSPDAIRRRHLSTVHETRDPSLQSQPQPLRQHHQQEQQQQKREDWQEYGQDRNRTPSTADNQSTSSRSPILLHRERLESHRVPYFRYFGPTAIVPGYKQMVVAVRDRRRSAGAGSASCTGSSPSSGSPHVGILPGQTLGTVSLADSDGTCISEDLPFYDVSDPAPVSPFTLHLLRLFFVHLGSSYPFLKEERFTRMVREKNVEPILVDAVCALSARFSDAPQFTRDVKLARSEYGQQYAQRAKAATVDTFAVPSVGAVQAMLMMAYEGFGADQDSALWMYLGLAIRMAVDLGLHTMVGVRYQGEKDPWYVRHGLRKVEGENTTADADANTDADAGLHDSPHREGSLTREEQVEVEQERLDTFWAVFMLDRVISSGTGRPVTFRDDDFEFNLPPPAVDPFSGWPAPFPSFLRIVHLYGRVSDVLNNIHDAKDLTKDKWNKLSLMEHELTRLYQNQDDRLHFNVTNFKFYLGAGQGTTFILLHFWFHALVIILHQPTLLTPFGSLNRSHQLLPNSRELSMSSAKTIADILSFAELIGPTSFIGNPFTSQPMYIAACAFLMESAAMASQPASRGPSPDRDDRRTRPRPWPGDDAAATAASASQAKASSTKHSLLASAANQNYARCYSSLKQLCTYWGGAKYILTALDQKSKGIWDCETYTHEEYESTKTTPRRESSFGHLPPPHFEMNPASPNLPPFAWSLAGTTNSPNSNLTLMYQNMQPGSRSHANPNPSMAPAPPLQPNLGSPSSPSPAGTMSYDPTRQSYAGSQSPFTTTYAQAATSAVLQHSPRGSRVQGRPAPFHPSPSQHTSGFDAPMLQPPTPASSNALAGDAAQGSVAGGMTSTGIYDASFPGANYSYVGQGGMGPLGDVITFDNPIEIGSLGMSSNTIPQWYEYLPGDVLGLFDHGSNMNGGGMGGDDIDGGNGSGGGRR